MPTLPINFPDLLLDDISEGRCLPFIGAGFSLNATIPNGKTMLDWEGLGKKAAEKLYDYQYKNTLDSLSAYDHEFKRTKLVEFLRKYLLIDEIQPGKVHEVFCRLPFQQVVTTNFDHLLEDTYKNLGKVCKVQCSNAHLAADYSKHDTLLLKMHGDLHNTEKLVVTEDDYSNFASNNQLLLSNFEASLTTKTLLIIGYSMDDPDFRQLDSFVKAQLEKFKRVPYVLLYDAKEQDVKRFERRGVKVIQLSGSNYADALENTFRKIQEYTKPSLITIPFQLNEISMPKSTKTTYDIFLSYAKEDKEKQKSWYKHWKNKVGTCFGIEIL